MRPVPDAIAKHVDGPSFGDLSLQTGKELAPRRAVLIEVQRFGNPGLRFSQECGKLNKVYAVLAVIILRISLGPARAITGRPLDDPPAALKRTGGGFHHGRANEAFQPLLGGVGGHGAKESSRFRSNARTGLPGP